MFSDTIVRKLYLLSTKILFCTALMVVLQLSTAISVAQSTFGEFVGTVKDPSGAVVAGCKVNLKNLGTAATRVAITDASGSYTIVNVEPGTYEMTLEASGFQRVTFPNLELTSRVTKRIDGSMTLASQAQAI